MAVFISILTFNINDDSFLTKSSGAQSNTLGTIGSYLASFLIYSFGLMSYLIVFFLLINSIAVCRKKTLRYFFIRLLFLLISIIFIPQIFLFFGWSYEYIDQIKPWGEISYVLFNLYQIEWVSYDFVYWNNFIFVQNFCIFKVSKIKFSIFH